MIVEYEKKFQGRSKANIMNNLLVLKFIKDKNKIKE